MTGLSTTGDVSAAPALRAVLWTAAITVAVTLAAELVVPAVATGALGRGQIVAATALHLVLRGACGAVGALGVRRLGVAAPRLAFLLVIAGVAASYVALAGIPLPTATLPSDWWSAALRIPMDLLFWVTPAGVAAAAVLAPAGQAHTSS